MKIAERYLKIVIRCIQRKIAILIILFRADFSWTPMLAITDNFSIFYAEARPPGGYGNAIAGSSIEKARDQSPGAGFVNSSDDEHMPVICLTCQILFGRTCRHHRNP
jgi:hypothetical protein